MEHISLLHLEVDSLEYDLDILILLKYFDISQAYFPVLAMPP